MTGFRCCATCDGYGFTKVGTFGQRSFQACPVCGGMGQTDVAALDPGNAAEPDPPPRPCDTCPCDVEF